MERHTESCGPIKLCIKWGPNHGRPHIGANGVSWPPPAGKMDEKLKYENMQKRAVCLCYILIAISAGRCTERRYADHIFTQIYFKMHQFVLKFSKFSSPQAVRGHWPPTKNPADALGTVDSLQSRGTMQKWACSGDADNCQITLDMC